MQHNLEKQLKVAQTSLRELNDRLDVVQQKGDEFNSNKDKLTKAIGNIKEHLTVLQNDPSVNYTSPVKRKYDIAAVDTKGVGAKAPTATVALELQGMTDLI